MRGWVSGENSDVHAYAVFSQAQKPFHRGTSEMRAARSGIGAGADPPAHGTTRTIHKVSVQTGVMIRVFLEHVLMAGRRFVSASTGRNRTIGDDLFADHEVSPLLRNRYGNTGVIGRCLFE